MNVQMFVLRYINDSVLITEVIFKLFLLVLQQKTNLNQQLYSRKSKATL